MSGHSKWATIKHKKGAADAKRGALFTKLIKEITMAARLGGGAPDGTRGSARPSTTPRRSTCPPRTSSGIQRGTGELPGVSYEELSYEGYGPGGAAVYIEGDDRQQEPDSSRDPHDLLKHGGNLGAEGSVRFLFQKKGYLAIEKDEGVRGRGDGSRHRGGS